eukprot:Hpha_TRINITY_DN16398_c2_g3::TRINITY_DN16398_c2_g3_i1::g.62854::m.62854
MASVLNLNLKLKLKLTLNEQKVEQEDETKDREPTAVNDPEVMNAGKSPSMERLVRYAAHNSQNQTVCINCGSTEDYEVGVTVACSHCGAYIHVPNPKVHGAGPQGEEFKLSVVKERDVFEGRRELTLTPEKGLRRKNGLLLRVQAAAPTDSSEPVEGPDLAFVHEDLAQRDSSERLFDVRRGPLPENTPLMDTPLIATIAVARAGCCWRHLKISRITDAGGHELGRVSPSSSWFFRLRHRHYPASSPDGDMITGPMCCLPWSLFFKKRKSASPVPVAQKAAGQGSTTVVSSIGGLGRDTMILDFHLVRDPRRRLRIFGAAVLLALETHCCGDC